MIPGLENLVDLRTTDIVEIGCGTGSTSAALAIEARSIDAYDIVASAVDVAAKRAEMLGLANASFHHYSPEQMLVEVAAAQLPNTVHLVVCFAVLEHAKHQERLNLLRLMWDILTPGGLLVIGDTPNRLSYWDAHTSWLPFFDQLPHDLAIEYVHRSPRKGHVETMLRAQGQSQELAEETLIRLGRGVSYHEFELAIGDVSSLVVGDGFDPEPLANYGVNLETRLLFTYAKLRGLDVPPAFLRSTIDVILRKPGGTDVRPQRSRDLDKIVRPLGRTEEWKIAAEKDHEAVLFHAADSPDVMRVSFGAMPGSEAWRVRLFTRPREMRAGSDYQVSFRARTDKPRRMVCTLKQSQKPWANIGLHAEVALTPEWQEFNRICRPRADCADAVFAFEFGGSDVAVDIAGVVVQQAGNGLSGN